jgi:hypothetical protein
LLAAGDGVGHNLPTRAAAHVPVFWLIREPMAQAA